MDDPILMSRLEALRQDLDVVRSKLDESAWKPMQPTTQTRAESVEKLPWRGLENDLVKPIRQKLSKLEEIKDDVAKAAPNDNEALLMAWNSYGIILRDSQSLLRESLEIIGTLAIRNKGLDDRILHITNELVRECQGSAISNAPYFLLVHSLADTFSKTRARILRLRFPEWNIWNVALAAHELGHVVVDNVLHTEGSTSEDERTLTKFREEQIDSLLRYDTELNPKLEQGDDHAKEARRLLAEARVNVLLADAFATYTMGPAYACAATMLRFSPIVAEQGDRPRDVQRAYVVLHTLEWMNQQASRTGKPYTDIIKWLRCEWQRTLDLFLPGSTLNTSEEEYFKQLAWNCAKAMKESLLASALYPPWGSQTDGWARAIELSELWQKQWQDGQSLALPDNRTGTLRDVLNACWRSRLEITMDETNRPETKSSALIQVAVIAQNLCMEIIAPGTGRAPSRSIDASPSSGVVK